MAINKACSSGGNRPYPYTCKSPYVSYSALTDKTYASRHLPECSQEYLDSLPSLDQLNKLFQRPTLDNGESFQQKFCPKSTYLFPTFAQYLVDSFINTDIKSVKPDKEVEFNWSKTSSPHDIGLCPLYGKSDEQTLQLRLCSNEKNQKGLFKSQIIKGEEWAQFLFVDNGNGHEVKKEFDKLDYPQGLDHVCAMIPPEEATQIKKNIFAFGGERANLNPNVAAMNTLLLREHNRIAKEIEKENPSWDDERVFQITRNTTVVLALKLIMEEYIGGNITSFKLCPKIEPGEHTWKAGWNKPNWMSAEFSILYRLHALVPNTIQWGEKDYTIMEQVFHNDLLLKDSAMGSDLRKAFVNISNHRATAFTLLNTETSYLYRRDVRAVEMGRACKLAPYGDYCEYMGEPRPKSFEDITLDVNIQYALEEVYGTVDKVEFFVGLVAADHPNDSIFGTTMKKFIALDAFSQIYTNPLLSEHVWAKGPEVFSQYGFAMITGGKACLRDVVERNTKNGESLTDFVGMTNPNYVVKDAFSKLLSCKPAPRKKV